MQAEGTDSDCMLEPVYYIADPIRGDDNILVMCEVMNADGTVHPSNTRAHLREVAEKPAAQEAGFGIEQEYTRLQGRSPLGWPEGG